MNFQSTIDSFFSNQNREMLISSTFYLFFELYQIVSGTLYLVFVPQLCGDKMCNLSEKISFYNPTFLTFVSYINFICLFFFLVLYSIESYREYKLIKILDVNPKNPTTSRIISKIFATLSIENKKILREIQKLYKRIFYFCLLLFIINVICTLIILSNKSLGYETFLVFFTSLLFVFSKIYHVAGITYVDKNIYYSAYLTSYVLFNDIDQEYKPGENYELQARVQEVYQDIQSYDAMDNI
jgi:hypothetical protein